MILLSTIPCLPLSGLWSNERERYSRFAFLKQVWTLLFFLCIRFSSTASVLKAGYWQNLNEHIEWIHNMKQYLSLSSGFDMNNSEPPLVPALKVTREVLYYLPLFKENAFAAFLMCSDLEEEAVGFWLKIFSAVFLGDIAVVIWMEQAFLQRIFIPYNNFCLSGRPACDYWSIPFPYSDFSSNDFLNALIVFRNRVYAPCKNCEIYKKLNGWTPSHLYRWVAKFKASRNFGLQKIFSHDKNETSC